MVSALHAQRILEAWDVTAPDQRDNGLFQFELRSALSSCRTASPVSSLEDEQQAVLESVAHHLSSTSPRQTRSSYRLQAGLSLLRHLSARVH